MTSWAPRTDRRALRWVRTARGWRRRRAGPGARPARRPHGRPSSSGPPSPGSPARRVRSRGSSLPRSGSGHAVDPQGGFGTVRAGQPGPVRRARTADSHRPHGHATDRTHPDHASIRPRRHTRRVALAAATTPAGRRGGAAPRSRLSLGDDPCQRIRRGPRRTATSVSTVSASGSSARRRLPSPPGPLRPLPGQACRSSSACAGQRPRGGSGTAYGRRRRRPGTGQDESPASSTACRTKSLTKIVLSARLTDTCLSAGKRDDSRDTGECDGRLRWRA